MILPTLDDLERRLAYALYTMVCPREQELALRMYRGERDDRALFDPGFEHWLERNQSLVAKFLRQMEHLKPDVVEGFATGRMSLTPDALKKLTESK